jgi:hypothetical protein
VCKCRDLERTCIRFLEWQIAELGKRAESLIQLEETHSAFSRPYLEMESESLVAKRNLLRHQLEALAS